MDTENNNDFKENDGSSAENSGAQSGQYYNQGYQQYQQPQGYYNMYQPNVPEKKKKIAGRVLVALFIILSLVAGGLLTAFVIMPLVNGDFNGAIIGDLDNSGQEQNDDGEVDDNSEAILPQDNTNDSAGPQTTANAEIGGEAPSIDQSGNPIVQIAQNVSPSVVGIGIIVDYEGYDQQTVSQEVGYGTGFIISENGYIATNNHVVEGADSLSVTLFDGTKYSANVVGTDAASDLAVIKIDAQGLTPAAFGDSEALLVGETVVAIGNPLGKNLAGSVTSGIVSALNREITVDGYTQYYIQTDTAINSGNSGGPLVNIEGKVIGINTLKSSVIGTEGLGFAIPVNTAIPVLQQLMTEGYIKRPFIGIWYIVDVENKYNPEGSPEGVTVVDIVENGPADNANIQVNDIIISIDGIEIKTENELKTEINKHEVGDKLQFIVWRQGTSYKTMVTIGDLNNMG